jgi:CHAD domain-containing protein
MLGTLAAARPWEWAAVAPADPAAEEKRAELLSNSLDGYAARVLDKRLEALLEPGADIVDLPPTALHAIRLHGKRMRYAAEFFAPLFPGHGARRFIRRLTVLQERLGHLNDGEVASDLIAQLGLTNGARSYAAGVVRGFVAARSGGARAQIDESWRKFRKLEPFWS